MLIFTFNWHVWNLGYNGGYYTGPYSGHYTSDSEENTHAAEDGSKESAGYEAAASDETY